MLINILLGGTLALIVLAVDDHGQSSGNTKNCKVPFPQVLYQVWKSMAEGGVITLVRGLTPRFSHILKFLNFYVSFSNVT